MEIENLRSLLKKNRIKTSFKNQVLSEFTDYKYDDNTGTEIPQLDIGDRDVQRFLEEFPREKQNMLRQLFESKKDD